MNLINRFAQSCRKIPKIYLILGVAVLVALASYLIATDIMQSEQDALNNPPSLTESSNLTGSTAYLAKADMPSYECRDGRTRRLGEDNNSGGYYYLFHVNERQSLEDALA